MGYEQLSFFAEAKLLWPILAAVVASRVKISRRFGFRTVLSAARQVSHLRDTVTSVVWQLAACSQQTQFRC